MEKSVTKILEIISELPKSKQAEFKKIFLVSVFDSEMNIPEQMKQKLTEKYGDIDKIRMQRIVRIDNLFTWESTLFNSLRASRPMQKSGEEIELDGNDDFCNPLKLTPSDTFGRIKGKHSITASNLMKYDCYHDVVIFNEHNPLKFSYESISDAIDVAFKWFGKVNKNDKEAVYPFLIWNCLWRAGASIVHGHMQTTVTKNRHYPKVELLKKDSEDYKKRYKRDYFTDLYNVHEYISLGIKYKDVKIISYLTPIKEKEIMIISNHINNNLKKALYKILRCFIDELGVKSFNLVLIMPPLNKKWKNFPYIVRIVDRGELNNKTSDIGAMELYAGSKVVSSDPFTIAAKIKKCFKK